jgi:hypothetical protein
MLSDYQVRMIASFSRARLLSRAGLALLALGTVLSGCAEIGEQVSFAFADPSKYELWECKPLEDERKVLTNRAAELQGLMAKADTGAAGPVVAELAYRNEYVAVRGQMKFAEEAWRRNKCRDSPPGTAVATPPPAPSANGKPVHSRSGSAVY